MTAEHGSKGPRNRPRARLVCTNCRSKKIKCDAERLPQSQCTPCRANKVKCHIEPDSDRRRHGAVHLRFAEMQQRIQSLEAIIKQNTRVSSEGLGLEENITVAQDCQKTQPLSSTDEHEAIMASPIDTIVVRPQSIQQIHSADNGVGLQWQPLTLDNSARIQNDPVDEGEVPARTPLLPTCRPTSNLISLPKKVNPISYAAHLTNENAVDTANKANDILYLEEDNMREDNMREYHQTDIEDLAFYGSAPQPHLRSSSGDSITGVDANDNTEGQRTINVESGQLRKALLDIFFKTQPYSQIIVDETLFRRDRPHRPSTRRTSYYSDFLESAILASATRHSTSAEVRAVGKDYAARAKSQLAAELDQPNIACLQGFLLLSDFEATRGCARTGWTYCSIAAGLVVDLALHVEAPEYTSQSAATQSATQCRVRLLLGTFVYATLWSLYLGRPNSISSPVLLAVQRSAITLSCNDTFYMWVQLCLRMLDIIEILNAPSSDKPADYKMHLCSHEVNLRAAFDGVPPDLSFSDSRIEELDATAYTPHIQYFGLQITLYRSMARPGQQRNSTRGDVRPKGLEHIHFTIHESAVRIAKLVLSYQRIFGTENMVTVMLDNIYVAAIALVAHIIRAQNIRRSVESDVRWLQQLNDTLESTEKHFPIARRMRLCLEQMIIRNSLTCFFPKLLPVPPSAPTPTTIPQSQTAYNNLPITHQIPDLQGTASERLDTTATLPNEDTSWTQYLAWNMPFIPDAQDIHQTFEATNGSSPHAMT